MSAPSDSRRGTAAGSVSRCPDFVRERCAACPRACIQTKENAGVLNSVTARKRRNINWTAKTSAPFRKPEQHSS